MTKYACYLTNPEMVAYEIEKAVYIAMDGRRGPVWIDVPQDIQNSIVEVESLSHFELEKRTSECLDNLLSYVVSEIETAKRPCILMGTGIQGTHSEDVFEQMVEKIKIPIIGGAWVGDIFYSEHFLYYGLSGNAGGRAGNFILQNADYILVLGNSLSYKQTGYDITSFAPNAKICMVDIDRNEYMKNQEKIDRFINCDIVKFMSDIYCYIQNPICASSDWIEYCDRVYTKFPSWEGEITAEKHNRVNKYILWKKLLNKLPKNTLFALGNSSVGMAANQIGRKYKNQRMISNYICGSMGYDLPAAIGLAVASKQEVYCVTGDGSIMMNLQELQTIVYNKLPIKIIVMENNGYGAIRQTCKNFFSGEEFGCSPDTGISFPEFSKIAEAFGYKYEICIDNEMLDEKILWLMNIDGNAILEIKQQLDDPVYPKLMSKIDENGEMTSPKLHDMYPFVSNEDMKWLMMEE